MNTTIEKQQTRNLSHLSLVTLLIELKAFTLDFEGRSFFDGGGGGGGGDILVGFLVNSTKIAKNID